MQLQANRGQIVGDIPRSQAVTPGVSSSSIAGGHKAFGSQLFSRPIIVHKYHMHINRKRSEDFDSRRQVKM